MLPSAICCLQRFEREAAAFGAERLLLRHALAVGGDLPRLCRIGQRLEGVAGLRKAGQAEHFDRRRRRRHLDRLTAVVNQRADAPDNRAGDEGVADAQRAVLDEDGGHRTAPAIELRFEHGARRVPLRVRLVLSDVGDEQDHLEQLVEPGSLLRRHRHHDRLAAPVFGHEVQIGELALDALGIGAGLVDLVDRDDDRHVRRLRVIDRFPRLRHDAIVGRDDEHDDVGDLRAAGAHQRERLVARRVEEDDVAAGGRRDVIGADVLRNAAGLALGDTRRADGVEQRRLAVIDVTHDGDDRRARDRVFRLHFFRFHLEHVLLERAELHFGPEFSRDHRRGFGVDGAVDGHHQTACRAAS